MIRALLLLIGVSLHAQTLQPSPISVSGSGGGSGSVSSVVIAGTTGQITVSGTCTITTTGTCTLSLPNAVVGILLAGRGFPYSYLAWSPGTIATGACATNTLALLDVVAGSTLIGGFPVLPSALMTATVSVAANDLVAITVCNFSGSDKTIGTSLWKATLIQQ